MNRQRTFTLITSTAGIISIFLPWVTVSVNGFATGAKITVNGFQGFGILAFFSFAFSALISLKAGEILEPFDKTLCLLLKSCGIIALLALSIFIANKSWDIGDGFGFEKSSFSFGIWIAVFSASGIIASALLLRGERKSK